jgi:hypothetical protein
MTMYDARPRIKIPLSPLQLGVEIATASGLVAMLVYAWDSWPELPERIPLRFGLYGQPTRLGSRASLWLIPCVALAIYAALGVLQRMPHVYNYPTGMSAEEAPRLYRIGVSLVVWMKFEVVMVFAVISWMQIEVALGRLSGLEPWILPTLVTINLGTVAFHVLWMKRGGR